MLDVLGVVALLLVLVVGVVYLQARQRSRMRVDGALGPHGTGAGTMRRSLVLELMIVLFAALAVGATTGLIGAAIVIPTSTRCRRSRRVRSSSSPWIEVAAAAVGFGDRRVRRRLAGRSRRIATVPLGEVLRVAE